MALAITTEQEQLVDAVSRFADRHAPIDKTRAAFDSIAAANYRPGGRNSSRAASTRCTCRSRSAVRAAHLADMACVVEAAAAALLPGPLLSTATASAVASLADASASIVDRRSGRRRDRGRRPARAFRRAGRTATRRAGGSTARRARTLGICAAQHILLAAHTDDGAELWFALDAGSPGPGFTVEQQQGTDLCTDVGRAAASSTTPSRRVRLLTGISTERARCIVVGLRRVRGRRHRAPLRGCGDRLHPHPRAVRQSRSVRSRPCSTRRPCCS